MGASDSYGLKSKAKPKPKTPAMDSYGLAQAFRQYAAPRPTTPLASAFSDYADRVDQDFSHGLDESAQGFGEMLQGQFSTGIPRTMLGGLGWMGSPVSGAVSPILSPILEPVAGGIHDYVGKPIENATGYPADLTTEIALALALPKALHGAGKVVNHSVPYLASLGDAVGSRMGAPADAYFSGPGLKAPEGIKAYHGTDAEYADMIRRDGFKIGGLDGLNDQHPLPGISTTPSRSTAEYYAGGEEYATNPDRAMAVLELRLAGDKSHYPKLDSVEKRYRQETGNRIDADGGKPFLEWAKKNDIRGVHTPENGGEYRVFDPAHISIEPGPKSPISSPVGGGSGKVEGMKRLTKQQMLARGAAGHLSHGYEMKIPLDKIDGLDPTPAASEGMPYVKGRKITQPIEVVYDPLNDKYMLYDGNHRVTQAKLNGDSHIPAFVEVQK